eukprot:11228357-Lingulodinium_polyedra.AAC.3
MCAVARLCGVRVACVCVCEVDDDVGGGVFFFLLFAALQGGVKCSQSCSSRLKNNKGGPQGAAQRRRTAVWKTPSSWRGSSVERNDGDACACLSASGKRCAGVAAFSGNELLIALGGERAASGALRCWARLMECFNLMLHTSARHCGEHGLRGRAAAGRCGGARKIRPMPNGRAPARWRQGTV